MRIQAGCPLSFTPSDGRWIVAVQYKDDTPRLRRVVGWAVEVVGHPDDEGTATQVTTYISEDGHPAPLPANYTCALYRDDDPDLLEQFTADEIKRAA